MTVRAGPKSGTFSCFLCKIPFYIPLSQHHVCTSLLQKQCHTDQLNLKRNHVVVSTIK